jgi:hypothetical protein
VRQGVSVGARDVSTELLREGPWVQEFVWFRWGSMKGSGWRRVLISTVNLSVCLISETIIIMRLSQACGRIWRDGHVPHCEDSHVRRSSEGPATSG